jgi:ABC-type transport system involved in cytochrome c biogenesis permease component
MKSTDSKIAGLAASLMFGIAILYLLAQTFAPNDTQNMPGFAPGLVVVGLFIKLYQVYLLKK